MSKCSYECQFRVIYFLMSLHIQLSNQIQKYFQITVLTVRLMKYTTLKTSDVKQVKRL